VKTNKTKAAAKAVVRIAAVQKAQKTASNPFFSLDDPNGSYTGVCKEKYERPVQDADDL